MRGNRGRERLEHHHEGTTRTFSLSRGNYQSNGDRLYSSYSNPRPHSSYCNLAWNFGPVWTTPGEFGAGKSRLYPLLKGGHQGVTLSSEELRTIALWLDMNSDSLKWDAQAKGEAVSPSIEYRQSSVSSR